MIRPSFAGKLGSNMGFTFPEAKDRSSILRFSSMVAFLASEKVGKFIHQEVSHAAAHS
jgi:hypothetical protein